MTRNWQHLAMHLTEARVRLGMSSRTKAEAVTGVSERSIADYESGRPRATIPPKLRQLAAAYGWRPGSIEAVLAGGDPTLTEPPAQLTLTAGEARALEEALRRGLISPAMRDAIVADVIVEPSTERPTQAKRKDDSRLITGG